ncbi:MAG TPA: alpha/beta fold hydrolase [Acidimicrobiales bacterium]|nr:alpha/beta fold hydrolase [Acidimicrobiales bacterium]
MVHGIIAEGMLYARTLRRLAGMGFRVIAIDSAGHGRSASLGASAWSWDAYVDLHRRVLDELGVRRAVLLGHSMGGRIVVDLASRDPDRALAVIPVDAAIGQSFDAMTRAIRYAPPLVPFGLGLLVADTLMSGVRGRRQMGSIARLAAPSLGDRLRSLPALVPAFAATLQPRSSTAMLHRLAADAVPVVVIHGDRDLVTWFASGRSAARAANGTLVRVERGGHSWLLEDADTLPAIVGSLLDGPLAAALPDGVSISDLYGPEALALTLDRPMSEPYRLRAGHAWRLETSD